MTSAHGSASIWRKAACAAMAAVVALALAAPAHATPLEAGGTIATSAVQAQAAKVKLAKKSVTAKALKYTDKAQKPDVTVKAGGKVLEAGKDYKLTVRNAKGKAVRKPKAAGAYTAVVKGKGAYKGTVRKKFKVYSKNGKKWTAYWKAVPVTKTVTVVDEEAWDEPVYGVEEYMVCNRCKFESQDAEEFGKHMDMHDRNNEYASEGTFWKYPLIETIHHPEVSHTEKQTVIKTVKSYRWK